MHSMHSVQDLNLLFCTRSFWRCLVLPPARGDTTPAKGETMAADLWGGGTCGPGGIPSVHPVVIPADFNANVAREGYKAAELCIAQPWPCGPAPFVGSVDALCASAQHHGCQRARHGGPHRTSTARWTTTTMTMPTRTAIGRALWPSRTRTPQRGGRAAASSECAAANRARAKTRRTGAALAAASTTTVAAAWAVASAASAVTTVVAAPRPLPAPPPCPAPPLLQDDPPGLWGPVGSWADEPCEPCELLRQVGATGGTSPTAMSLLQHAAATAAAKEDTLPQHAAAEAATEEETVLRHASAATAATGGTVLQHMAAVKEDTVLQHAAEAAVVEADVLQRRAAVAAAKEDTLPQHVAAGADATEDPVRQHVAAAKEDMVLQHAVAATAAKAADVLQQAPAQAAARGVHVLPRADAAATARAPGGWEGAFKEPDIIAGANPQANWLGNILGFGYRAGWDSLGGEGVRHAPAGALCNCKTQCLSCGGGDLQEGVLRLSPLPPPMSVQGWGHTHTHPLHPSPQPLFPQTTGARKERRCGSTTFLEGATGPAHRWWKWRGPAGCVGHGGEGSERPAPGVGGGDSLAPPTGGADGVEGLPPSPHSAVRGLKPPGGRGRGAGAACIGHRSN